MSDSILVVDDDDMLRELITTEFEMRGFESYEASDGIEALQVLQKHPGVSIVLSDIRMPKMDGIELLKRIKKQNQKSPLVMLITGYSSYDTKKVLELGADGFFEKPFSLKQVLDKVSSVIQQNKEL